MDFSIPSWFLPAVVVFLVISLTFPLAVIVFTFSEGKRKIKTRISLLAWVILSGLHWVYYTVQLDFAILASTLSYSFPVAVLAFAITWRLENKKVCNATIVWMVLSAIPWFVSSILGWSRHL